MYKEKLARLNAQIEALHDGTHPEYLKRIKKLETEYQERLRLNEVHRDYLFECLEREYTLEKNAADKEYEDKKVDLRENLLTDYEDKRKMIENERNTMELNSDSTEIKPTVTRKLRRRPNDPMPLTTNEKRRKPNTGQLIYQLDEKDIDMDLKFLTRPTTPTSCKLFLGCFVSLILLYFVHRLPAKRVWQWLLWEQLSLPQQPPQQQLNVP